jgi:hypothetical protein
MLKLPTFNSSQKFTGTGYTGTVAFLVVAFVASPALLVLSRPFGYASVSLAVLTSAICVSAAYINWKRFSQLSMPSIVAQRVRMK